MAAIHVDAIAVAKIISSGYVTTIRETADLFQVTPKDANDILGNTNDGTDVDIILKRYRNFCFKSDYDSDFVSTHINDLQNFIENRSNEGYTLKFYVK